MKIPEFTAEASLYVASNRYRSFGQHGEGQRFGVIPQLGGPEYKGYQGCLDDCMDQHPGWTLRQCAHTCRDPFTGVDLGTSRSWFNDLLTQGGIKFWEVACGTLLHPIPCGWLADVMRRQS
jgi:hypothetical protein